MSVLAQAAGLLDIEGSAEEDGNGSLRSYNNSSSSLSGGDGGGGVGETRRNVSNNSNGMVDCRSSFGSSHGSSSYPYGGVRGHRHHHHNGSVPDHGSTPPGSATPPPCGGAASGGVAAAGDDPSFGGGDRNVNPEACAFAVGTGETVCTNKHGYHGGGGGGGGGGKSAYGEEGGGGDRVTPQWAASSAVSNARGAPPSSSSQRPGWFVGPGGVQRRSLESVPGPWRPYWRGEDGSNEDSAAGSAAAASRGVGMKR